jgi:hypothetical protein
VFSIGGTDPFGADSVSLDALERLKLQPSALGNSLRFALHKMGQIAGFSNESWGCFMHQNLTQRKMNKYDFGLFTATGLATKMKGK